MMAAFSPRRVVVNMSQTAMNIAAIIGPITKPLGQLPFRRGFRQRSSWSSPDGVSCQLAALF